MHYHAFFVLRPPRSVGTTKCLLLSKTTCDILQRRGWLILEGGKELRREEREEFMSKALIF